MKISAMLLCLLFIAVTVSPAELVESDEAPLSISCCFSVTFRKLPFAMLQSYSKTSTQCDMAAVIFKTKRGREICADPTQKWVSKYMKLLDQKSQTLQA
ncbi:C-C motif chemokine 8 [Phodopus roborovskii]|uniref:C-C motif chemokine n=1 Tax=Phodopus roborovskii TaxID=109678 RepID=A0AAU9YZB5_PHORO|nr:C-C motif chemokine 8 [Phodopus roborovskii]CAH6785784.1 Ccl8 [Phodopus roborovskii]